MSNQQKITFVIPSRNNLEFLKLAYQSIRNLHIRHEILVLDDASSDGTADWIKSLDDSDMLHYHNTGPDRIGIVGMFDKGIAMARTDIIFAFHADMIVGPNLDVNILKHLTKGTVVSATRIEPPLHPRGPEKITQDWGNEPYDIDFSTLMNSINYFERENVDKTTEGIFAPWCMYKDDYLAVGGHDELFAPQSKEDSDLFNRFVLNRYNVIQSWDALVYHFTSRGSRFNIHAGGAAGKDSPEWQYTTTKNARNFIRKWGHFVKHDQYMKPIIPPKYDIGFIIHNCSDQLLNVLEPWCSDVYVDCQIDQYIWKEQPNTKLDLLERIHDINTNITNDIVVTIDGSRFNNEDFYVVQELANIIQQTNDTGEFGIGNLNMQIKQLNTYEHTLIKAKI
jgi:glycosyltransferase involved in cell wall biosynthesis